MKRLAITPVLVDTAAYLMADVKVEEHPDGNFVAYDDVKVLEERLKLADEALDYYCGQSIDGYIALKNKLTHGEKA